MQHIVATTITGTDTLFCECLLHMLSDTQFRSIGSKQSSDEITGDRSANFGSALHIIVEVDRLDDNSVRDRVVAEIEDSKRNNSQSATIVIGRSTDRLAIMDLLRAGADGYIPATTDAQTLVKLLDLAICGQVIVPKEFVHELCQRPAASSAARQDYEQLPNDAGAAFGFPPRTTEGRSSSVVTKLSAREQVILRFLMRGHSNKVIARDLDIAEATTKTHIKTILRKIGVSNRTQAAMWGVRHMMVQ